MLHKRACKNLFIILLIFSSSLLSAQQDSLSQQNSANKRREVIVYSGIGIFYAGLGTGLYYAWYKDYPFQRFHFFNDNSEWLQMDKAGHAFTCYAEGVNGIELMHWAGLREKKAVWIGGMIGFGVQTIVEVMDGRSAQWGFSWGDMAADAFGSGLAIAQQLAWKEQRVQLRISYFPTKLQYKRPEILGDNFAAGMLKDYNGQTYWLSMNIRSFAPASRWPAWLNIALGYGAYGMLTGNPGNTWKDASGNFYDYSFIKRERSFYLAPDINLEKIGYIRKHKTLYNIAKFLSFIKIPAPTLELRNGSIKASAIYF